MNKAGIKVIVGTPTYAFPTWLAREHPEVLATTPSAKINMVQGKTWILSILFFAGMPNELSGN